MSSLEIAASRYIRREGAEYLTMHAHKVHKAHSHPGDHKNSLLTYGRPRGHGKVRARFLQSHGRCCECVQVQGGKRACTGVGQRPGARAASRKVLGIPVVGVYMNPRVRGILTEPSGSKRAAVCCEATSFWWDRVNVECCAGGQDAPAPNAGILTSSVDCARTAYRAATPWIDHGCLPRTGGRSSTCSYEAAAAVQVPPNRRRRVQYSL